MVAGAAAAQAAEAITKHRQSARPLGGRFLLGDLKHRFALIKVNRLLTTTIKVNVPSNCRIAVDERGFEMKKKQVRFSLWEYILGGGWCGGGAGG